MAIICQSIDYLRSIGKAAPEGDAGGQHNSDGQTTAIAGCQDLVAELH